MQAQTIQISCQLDKNDQLDLIQTNNFDSRTAETQSIITQFTNYYIQETKIIIETAIKKAETTAFETADKNALELAMKLKRYFVAEYLTIINVELTYIEELKELQSSHPENGEIKNAAIALSVAFSEEIIEELVTIALFAIPGVGEARFLYLIGAKLGIAIATKEYYDKYIKDKFVKWAQRLIGNNPGKVNEVPKLDAAYHFNYPNNLSVTQSNLFLNDESIAGYAACLIDPNDRNQINTVWKLTTNTYRQEYVLYRINEENQKDQFGTILLIVSLNQQSTDKYVTVNDFPFELAINSGSESFDCLITQQLCTFSIPAPYGIQLGYKTDQTFNLYIKELKCNIVHQTDYHWGQHYEWDEEICSLSFNVLPFFLTDQDSEIVGLVVQDNSQQYSQQYFVSNLTNDTTYSFIIYDINGFEQGQYTYSIPSTKNNESLSIPNNYIQPFPLANSATFVLFNTKLYCDQSVNSCGTEAQIFDMHGTVGGKFEVIETSNDTKNSRFMYNNGYSTIFLPDGGFMIYWFLDPIHLLQGQIFDKGGSKIGNVFTQCSNNLDSSPCLVVPQYDVNYLITGQNTGTPNYNDAYLQWNQKIYQNRFRYMQIQFETQLVVNKVFSNMTYQTTNGYRFNSSILIVSESTPKVKQCEWQNLSKFPSINLINIIENKQSFGIKTDDKTLLILTGKPGINYFQIQANSNFQITNLNIDENQVNNTYFDYINLTPLAINTIKRVLQTIEPLILNIQQVTGDTLIKNDKFNVKINLQNILLTDLHESQFIYGNIGNVVLQHIVEAETQQLTNQTNNSNSSQTVTNNDQNLTNNISNSQINFNTTSNQTEENSLNDTQINTTQNSQSIDTEENLNSKTEPPKANETETNIKNETQNPKTNIVDTDISNKTAMILSEDDDFLQGKRLFILLISVSLIVVIIFGIVIWKREKVKQCLKCMISKKKDIYVITGGLQLTQIETTQQIKGVQEKQKIIQKEDKS